MAELKSLEMDEVGGLPVLNIAIVKLTDSDIALLLTGEGVAARFADNRLGEVWIRRENI
jgi:hypothetical protein